MTEQVVVKNLYKIFGPNPDRAFALIEKGLGKDEIFKETGLTIGVQDASFTVNKGEIFVVMGLSGSGKSTLVRMLNRLIEPTRGEVLIDGENVVAMNEKKIIEMRRHRMGMVFQTFALMPHLSVVDNAAYGLIISGVNKAEREKRAMDALRQVGLDAYAQSYPQELSGGMQQRVGLARALAQDPAILLMDEAFSALDPLIRSEMQDELLKLQEQTERTVIFISHDLHEAIRIGDRIAIMEGGRVVQIGTPDDILKNPADQYVRAFFRGVDPTTVFTVGDVARRNQVTVRTHKDAGPRATLERLQEEDRNFAYVLSREGHFKGVVAIEDLQQAIRDDKKEISGLYLEGVEPVPADTPLQEILTLVREYPCPVPVVDEEIIYQGVVSRNCFLQTIEHGVAESEEAKLAAQGASGGPAA
jgi:glycine betaine/proline transport system ATP-binding protein